MHKIKKSKLSISGEKIRQLAVSETAGVFGASMCNTGGGPCRPPHSAGIAAGLEPCMPLPPSGQE